MTEPAQKLAQCYFKLTCIRTFVLKWPILAVSAKLQKKFYNIDFWPTAKNWPMLLPLNNKAKFDDQKFPSEV